MISFKLTLIANENNEDFFIQITFSVEIFDDISEGNLKHPKHVFNQMKMIHEYRSKHSSH